MLKITSNWVLPYFCRNYCHPGTVHSHWFQTPFCSCNIWRGWLDSSHWFHVSIGLKNWSLQSSQRHNTWTGIVNRNWLVPSNDGPLLPGVKVVLNICGFFFLTSTETKLMAMEMESVAFIPLYSFCIAVLNGFLIQLSTYLQKGSGWFSRHVLTCIIKSCLILHQIE